jgi:hypothetical protein
MKPFMKLSEVLHILQAHHDEFARQYGVRSLALFGSVARDQARPESDVDMLVEFNRPMGLFGLFALQDRLEALLGRPVDLGTPASLKPRLREAVLKELVHVV